MEKEIWKHVEGFSTRYEVSNFGRVRTPLRICKQGVNKKGYWYVNIVDDTGKHRQVETHRLIAIAFVHNEHNNKQVDHIDGNKLNNNANNLRWVTPKENSNNPNTLCKLRHVMKDDEFLKKRWNIRKARGGKTAPKDIFVYDSSLNLVATFPSVTQAAKFINRNHATVSVAIDSTSRTAGGYIIRSKRIEPSS